MNDQVQKNKRVETGRVVSDKMTNTVTVLVERFERLLGELTFAIEPDLVRVPREGDRSRFLPVKDVPELEQRRPEIAAALSARGILQG